MQKTVDGILNGTNGAAGGPDAQTSGPIDGLDAERAKWQAYYESLPLQDEDEALKGFNGEWVESVAEILPPGARVLEAGCGAGWQSLALARAGVFRISLMDFTPAALDYARRLFAREHLSADFHEENIFAPGEPAYDLVFNAGVLEHYTFDQQVECVRAMASRSRRYVAALVPNRHCYWYWLWRIQQAGAGAWPFGKEVPVPDLTRVFEAAGLRSVRRAFLGQTWTDSMIDGVEGIEPTLRHLILQVHRSRVIPSAQKSYLVAAIGSVTDELPVVGRVWMVPEAAEGPEPSEAIAALADALALRIAADGKLLQVQSLLGAQTRASEQAAAEVRHRDAELAELRKKLAELEETARRAEAELREAQTERSRAMDEAESLRRRLAKVEAEVTADRQKQEWYRSSLATERHARQVLEAAVSASYADTVARIRDVVRSTVPRDATVLVVSKGDEELLQLDGRPAWHFPQDDRGEYAGYYPAASDAAIAHLESLVEAGGQFLLFPNTAFWWLEHYREFREYLDATCDRAWGDERCVIYKLNRHKPAGKAHPRADARGSCPPRRAERAAPADRYDVVCFPIIPWDYRFQRPQQLMSRFAAGGHRVFYLSLEFRPSGEPYVVRRLADNIFEASLRGPRVNVYRDTLDDRSRDALLEAVDAMRRDCALGVAAAVVQLPFWWPLADRARERFGWPVVYDCMDHHAGFSTNHPLMVEQERGLLAGADLVVVASAALQTEARRHSRNVLLVRNACDYDHFAKVGSPPRGTRPVVGYYGAIADWFDSDLVADLAERRRDWDFALVGGTYTADVSRLSRLPNVTLAGEKPYAEIPDWLAKFDATILPFKRSPLTEATNPVKAYEILAAGRPLVSVPLPEMKQFEPLVRLASSAADFERQIGAALGETDGDLVRRRRAFAKEHTWQKRFETLATAVRELMPKERPAAAASNPRDHLIAKLESVAGSGRLPVVYTTPVDWNIPMFQRPQQMCLALGALGWPTLYMTPNSLDGVRGTTTLAEHCYLVPLEHLDLCLETLERFVLVVLSTNPHNPTSATFRAIRDRALIVYDFIDELHPDIHPVSDAMRESHEYLIRHSDLISATADRLYEQATRLGDVPVVLCPNGADVPHFRLSRRPDPPADLRPILADGRPVIGYFGALARWFDYELILAIAAARPDFEIVLLGVDYDSSFASAGLSGLRNVHYLGPKEYSSLPQYAAYFDVATIPFLVNDVTQATSPVKLFEYMAARRPIVTTDLRECRKYRSVLIARSHEDFIAKLDEALRLRSDPAYLALLDREADENGWAGRARALTAEIEKLAATRGWRSR